jgi:hypothetical protein
MSNIFLEAKMVWARRGGKLTRKYRCIVGKRKGRVVASPAQCDAPIDVSKRTRMKQMQARQGERYAKKAQRTKKFSPVSQMVRRMNK